MCVAAHSMSAYIVHIDEASIKPTPSNNKTSTKTKKKRERFNKTKAYQFTCPNKNDPQHATSNNN